MWSMVCLSECQHDMPADGVVRSCCGCELHSTDIELYLYSSAENGERHIRCTVTDLPPAITAECPCPERVPVLREKSAERRSPFVQEASILPVGFRAPPRYRLKTPSGPVLRAPVRNQF